MRPATTNETSHALATVVPTGRHPAYSVGVEARHGELGWVLVEQAKGNERLRKRYAFRDVPEAEFSERFDAMAIQSSRSRKSRPIETG